MPLPVGHRCRPSACADSPNESRASGGRRPRPEELTQRTGHVSFDVSRGNEAARRRNRGSASDHCFHSSCVESCVKISLSSRSARPRSWRHIRADHSGSGVLQCLTESPSVRRGGRHFQAEIVKFRLAERHPGQRLVHRQHSRFLRFRDIAKEPEGAGFLP